MNRGLKAFSYIAAHASIVLAGMLLTFFVIDRFNDAMGFMTSEITRWLVACLALSAATSAGLLIAQLRHRERERQWREAAARGQQHSPSHNPPPSAPHNPPQRVTQSYPPASSTLPKLAQHSTPQRQSRQTAHPVRTAQPVQSAHPAHPVQSAHPAHPVQSAHPAHPVQPEDDDWES